MAARAYEVAEECDPVALEDELTALPSWAGIIQRGRVQAQLQCLPQHNTVGPAFPNAASRKFLGENMNLKIKSDNISRRALIKNGGLAVAGAGLIGVAGMEGAQSQSTQPNNKLKGARALALIGDRYHNSDYIRVSLQRLFKELDIPLDLTIQYERISASLLKQYQVFLTFRDGMIWPAGYLGPDAYTAYEANLETPKSFPDPVPVTWITAEQSAAVKDFVNQGGGLYALHNSCDISNSEGGKGFREVMGGAYNGHPPLRPFRVQPTANKHPITDGIPPFIVTDEQHYATYDKDPKYMILEGENTDGLKYRDLGTKSNSGWAYDYGKGRVVFTGIGHTIHAMWHPQYLEIQRRSVRWLLRDL
ncbi:MAG: ThuA domain-containing protein [Granulicella sp.]